MLTKWEYSDETEAERLLQCAHQMAVGFYRANNFIVLPSPKKADSKIVSFPFLNYNSIPRFWDIVKRLAIANLPVKVDKSLVRQVQELLKATNLPKNDYSGLSLKWAKIETAVLEEIYKIIPSKKGSVKRITIYPTSFGTGASFNRIGKNGQVFIYLRMDQGVGSIIESVLTSLTREDVYQKLNGMWQESEIIVDWLVTESSLSRFLDAEDKAAFLPTMKGIRGKQQAKLMEESDNFYRKLGLPVNQKVFGLNGLTPEANKKPLENLSATEKVILRLLIQKAGGVVTFDEFGNELFSNESDYSLYAISKNIERLRNKLEANGISGSYIQTLRGKGYLLKN